jgi:hypothetical protein
VLRYSLLMLLVVFCTSAAIVALASVTPIIPNYVEREYAEHRQSNGILFFDGGYRDDGDFLLLGEMPNDDYSRGGVYFIGASEVRVSIMPWLLPPSERALIHNYAIGDMRFREIRHFVRCLVDEHGLLQAGPDRTAIILDLHYLLARGKDVRNPSDLYVKGLFERHGFYTYDWDAGIHRTDMLPLERQLHIFRDRANRFLRIALKPPSAVRPATNEPDWIHHHVNAIMGETWREDMAAGVEDLAALLDELDALGVRVVLLDPPEGSWQDDMPYEAAYRDMIAPVLASRNLPLADLRAFLADEEFGDDVHVRYAGQMRLHNAYRQLALEQLRHLGTEIAPPAADASASH